MAQLTAADWRVEAEDAATNSLFLDQVFSPKTAEFDCAWRPLSATIIDQVYHNNRLVL
jgi:hypothetical protein